jgi:hypothetical protein
MIYLEKLVKKYTEKPWRWDFLTVNKNISIDFIVKNKNRPFKWDFKQLLNNPNITLDIVESNLHSVEWCMHGLSRIVTEAFHDRHPELNYVWGLGGMSNNPNLSYDFVSSYPDKDWDYSIYGLSRNKRMGMDYFKVLGNIASDPSMNEGITIEIIDFFKCRLSYPILSKYIDPDIVDYYLSRGDKTKNWNFGASGLSSNPRLTYKMVEKYPDKNWDYTVINIDFMKWNPPGRKHKIWKDLSCNPNVTPEFISLHLDKPWNFDAGGLSNNPLITPDFIMKHCARHWSYGVCGLSDNTVITESLLDRMSNKEWYFPSLSRNNSISIDYILAHPDKSWNYRYVNLNENISIHNIDMIDKNFSLLSMNPAITIEIVEKYIDEPWNWSELSRR